ncbi:PIN domain-containing protein [Clostridium culturomicium]|uniref:PIN domain-containing protein n=1 Tax=Clostridium culturomicium TaxID=1499683 RepID=UPI00058E2615|nr:PIN domain-containing protein [Clostridium culturomicium]
MYHLILDTCVLINLCTSHSDPTPLSQLKELINSNKVKILLPDIVSDEWTNIKFEKVIKQETASIKGKLKNLKELLKILNYGESEDTIRTVIENVTSSESAIIAKNELKCKEMIKNIDSLLTCQSTIKISPTQEVHNLIINRGISKKAPLHKKSSISDALIIFSSLEYIKEHSIQHSIFVSNNTTDFCESSNNSLIHSDLQSEFESNNIQFFNNIEQALNTITDNPIYHENILEPEINSMKCFRCGGQMDNGSWCRSQYGGLTFQYTCMQCGFRCDTGEFFD